MLVFSRRLSSRLTLVLLRWLASEAVVAADGVAGDVDADADVVVVVVSFKPRHLQSLQHTNNTPRQC